MTEAIDRSLTCENVPPVFRRTGLWPFYPAAMIRRPGTSGRAEDCSLNELKSIVVTEIKTHPKQRGKERFLDITCSPLSSSVGLFLRHIDCPLLRWR